MINKMGANANDTWCSRAISASFSASLSCHFFLSAWYIWMYVGMVSASDANWFTSDFSCSSSAASFSLSPSSFSFSLCGRGSGGRVHGWASGRGVHAGYKEDRREKRVATSCAPRAG